MMNIIEKDTLKYLILSQIPGMGPVTQNRLLRLSGGIEKCFSGSLKDLVATDAQVDKTRRVGKRRLEQFAAGREDESIIKKCKEIFEKCAEENIKIITPSSEEYPKRFADIEDMSLALYAKGCLNINDFQRSVGIVGARRCTQEGKLNAVDITRDEVNAGAAIISGMAKGIDSYAHTAALKNDGYTIAVLGNGPDICYPPEHKALYDAICQKGCLISEYPPETRPNRYMFPLRNRLIAALSDCIYVIDVGRISGTKTTVEAGLKYGKEVIEIDGKFKNKI